MKRLKLLTLLFIISGCKEQSVDETGYLQVPEIETTAEEALDETVRPVVVVGASGAVEKPGGTLFVEVGSTGEVTTTEIADPDGSFLTIVQAVQGDSLELTYELDGEDTAVLSLDGTAELAAPGCATCILPDLFMPPDEDGYSSIDLSILLEPMPPYLVFNETQGIAVRAETLAAPTRIRANQGDRACLFRIGASGDQTGLSLCGLVP